MRMMFSSFIAKVTMFGKRCSFPTLVAVGISFYEIYSYATSGFLEKTPISNILKIAQVLGSFKKL